MNFKITLDEINTPGLRRVYLWTLVDESGRTVAVGDSYYKWNARRAAKRAAHRYAAGKSLTPPSEEMDYRV